MLNALTQYSDEISTYPGELKYLRRKFEKLEEELSKPHEGANSPDYNICESPDYYKIELAAPGLKREDFFVNINQHGQLSVSALHKETQRFENEKYQKHTFNYDCFSREFLLPENIDTDFIRAEYRAGILSLWFVKTDKKYQKRASRVVVY
jgi:HSP20 family protein